MNLVQQIKDAKGLVKIKLLKEFKALSGLEKIKVLKDFKTPKQTEKEDRFYLESAGVESEWNNTQYIIKDRKYKNGNNTDEIAGYVRYGNSTLEIVSKYKDNKELKEFIASKFKKEDDTAQIETPIDPTAIETIKALAEIKTVLSDTNATHDDYVGLEEHIEVVASHEDLVTDEPIYHDVILLLQDLVGDGVVSDNINSLFVDMTKEFFEEVGEPSDRKHSQVDMDAWGFKKVDPKAYKEECLDLASMYLEYHNGELSHSEYLVTKRRMSLISPMTMKRIENKVMTKTNYKPKDVIIYDSVVLDGIILDRATKADAEQVKKYVMKRVPSGMKKDIEIDLSKGTVLISYNQLLNDQQRQLLEIGLHNAVKKTGAKIDYTHVSNTMHHWEVVADGVISDNITHTREFRTYQAWKRAVKKLNTKAKFTGDKEIDSSFVKGHYDADWDGESGEIRMMRGA
ncbi:MAG: hypothetical protein GQ474_10560 [Sulfurimonas sp.]|nr:hypothetical protein [Sulfurimonas sp.]